MARSPRSDINAPVPSGRMARAGRFARLAAGVTGAALGAGAQALVKGERPGLSDLFLTPGNARRVADELARLRGAAMKVGQMISMDAGDVLPPELAEILARVRERAAPMPPRQLKRVLEARWGRTWLTRFERFSGRPIAAASIGQVHRARTRDGRDLAIKVQYPGVRVSIDSDVDNVATLIGLSGLLPAGADAGPLLAEAKRQLHDEADYQREGAMMERFAALLADQEDLITPRLAEDLTAPDILAMSYLPGAPIETLASADQAVRDQVMERLADLTARELFEFGLMQSDPNFANFRYQSEPGRIVLLDFGAVQPVPAAVAADYRALLGAGLGGARSDLEHALTALGFLAPDTPAAQRDQVLDLAQIAFEPMRSRAPFSFAGADLVERLRAGGLRLRASGFSQIPDPSTLYVQRKIGGLYLLGARLNARITLRDRLEAYL